MDGSITYKRGRVVIDSRGAVKPVEVSLAQTAVLLIGQKLYCSSAALFEMAQYGVSVMLCDWRGVPVAALHSVVPDVLRKCGRPVVGRGFSRLTAWCHRAGTCPGSGVRSIGWR